MGLNKNEFISTMENVGDACIHFISSVSGKEKYTVGTIDFTTQYIKDKLSNLKTNKPKAQNCILIFSWDTDSFKQIDPSTVIKIEPLSHMIPNDPV